MSVINGYLPEIFNKVHPSWKRIILSKTLKPAFLQVINDFDKQILSEASVDDIKQNGLETYVKPAPEVWLEPFRHFDANNLRVIIVRKGPEDSFSSNVIIQKCLLNSKIITKIPMNPNLTNWAKQGVLLLNQIITKSKSLHEFWEIFTTKLIAYLGNEFLKTRHHNNFKVKIFLWGINISNLESFENYKCEYKPEDARFINCKHFTQVPEINWDTEATANVNHFNQFLYVKNTAEIMKYPLKLYNDNTQTRENLMIIAARKPIVKSGNLYIFCDGGCKGNGSAAAKASYGVYMPAKICDEITLTGEVKLGGLLKPITYKYQNGIEEDITFAKCTNNRAEIIAVIKALEYINTNWKDLGSCKQIVIVCDSLTYSINWVKNKLWKEFTADKSLTKVINSDLIKILLRYLWYIGRKLNPTCKVADLKRILIDSNYISMIHQRSHLTKVEKQDISPKQQAYIQGNEMADEICNIYLKNKFL